MNDNLRNKIRILIFDDEPEFLTRQKNTLDNTGKFEVKLCKNYDGLEECLELAKNNIYDLIIFDVMAPFPNLSKEETEDGTKTGLVFYKNLAMGKLNTKIVIWSRNREVLDSNLWGSNVKKAVIKNTSNDNQLLDIAQEVLSF